MSTVSEAQVIPGQRVRLRRFERADITPQYLGWLNDRELMRFSEQRFRSHDAESCLTYLESFRGTDNLFLAIVLDGDVVGTMTAYVDRRHGTADVGLLVGGARGRGVGKDAWQTLVEHLLASGIRKVTAGALRANRAMVAIMEQSGMQPDGVRVAQQVVDGMPDDIVHFAKFSAHA